MGCNSYSETRIFSLKEEQNRKFKKTLFENKIALYICPDNFGADYITFEI